MDPDGDTGCTREQMRVCELGVAGYDDALALQGQLRQLRIAGQIPDTLLLLEHPPVLTRGRRSSQDELLFAESFYRSRGIELHDCDRGGRITYHGPGQLVGYAVMRIGDVGAYLRTMEAAIIATLAGEGVQARSRHSEGPDFTGVWVGDRKIASIGVHVSQGVTTHGFAINVDNDLQPFSLIVACGLDGVAMTSLARELPAGRRADVQRLRRSVAHEFCAANDRQQRRIAPAELRCAAGGAGRGASVAAGVAG